MPSIILECFIKAPTELCFDMIRDERLHTVLHPLKSGPFGLGQRVSFESSVYGFRQRLTVEVTEFERPNRFVDELVEGKFKAFKHIHEFERRGVNTIVRDTVVWDSSFGFLKPVVDRLVGRRLRAVVTRRNARLKVIAEEIG